MNDAVPVKPVVGVNVKPPFVFSTSVPLAVVVSSTAVIVPPPLALSLPRTPGALTVNAVLNGVE